MAEAGIEKLNNKAKWVHERWVNKTNE